jgi:hypothetical protein
MYCGETRKSTRRKFVEMEGWKAPNPSAVLSFADRRVISPGETVAPPNCGSVFHPLAKAANFRQRLQGDWLPNEQSVGPANYLRLAVLFLGSWQPTEDASPPLMPSRSRPLSAARLPLAPKQANPTRRSRHHGQHCSVASNRGVFDVLGRTRRLYFRSDLPDHAKRSTGLAGSQHREIRGCQFRESTTHHPAVRRSSST